MHTDEYEISLGREIALCRRAIQRLASALQEREKRHAMTTESFLGAIDHGRLAEEEGDFRNWRRDHHELEIWQERLREYESALQLVRRI